MGVIHLIRHGQAAWDSDNYDQLSELGVKQSASLGMAWEAIEKRWDHAISGSMERHVHTAAEVIEGAGFGDGYDIDQRWNEFDHLALTGHLDAATRPSSAKEFQARLNSAIEDWMGGSVHAGESFAEFEGRVLAGFQHTRGLAGPGSTAVVFTSGGPIAMVVSHLLAGDASMFMRLNTVIVNASLTTVIVGTKEARLLSFNEHGHLPAGQVTYR